MQHGAGRVDDRLQQRGGYGPGAGFGLLVFTIGNRGSSHVNEERMGKAGVGERPCQPIYRRRTHQMILLLWFHPTHSATCYFPMESNRWATARAAVGLQNAALRT
jgi:hypothetical protein